MVCDVVDDGPQADDGLYKYGLKRESNEFCLKHKSHRRGELKEMMRR